MKFGETFTEYLHGEQEAFLHTCSHVEYKMLKKLLRSCRDCRASADHQQSEEEVATAEEEIGHRSSSDNKENCSCDKDKCKLCDYKFFGELTREASEVAGCFRSRVRRLLHVHVHSGGLQSYIWRLLCCFTDDHLILIQEGRILLDYITMNAVAIRKILKKYDKVHGSVHGRNFKSEMQAKRIELLQSPWLIELGAFYVNLTRSDMGEPGEFFREFSCDLSGTQPVMTMALSNSIKYEYNLTCSICLDTVFNPYALSCGHLFCKGCACSAASVLIFQGLKSAPREAKCPVCRSVVHHMSNIRERDQFFEVGVFRDAVHMQELDLLLKNRCKDYWKERFNDERTQMVKQAKEYWESQRITAMGI